MNGAREKLHSARASLDPVLGRRRPTTEIELDECAQTLKELKRACARLPVLPAVEATACAAVMCASLDEIIGRLKNRPRSAT